ncbi:stage II sporulation protein P [Lysinibacillus irui]|uniref:Stage II sporulation protein P n=3 Tax=Lysinibacillus TaxID=400634 RepID=A0AAJ5RHT2_9BACI|nr:MULTISPECIES: stage II sporulation protein P [Lysinibacillus]MEA0555002.1 stage II sporulation protein P [Lysinibacillus irui]MEA0565675.1 stage II sporulation protein P [Lysinibacillus irui]MEA0976717.1 stage II sporulation protein P [Lysinibacillus irui]MEA1042871.1 stage II sporulation protein P [Lysinibacillus irui]WDV05633.1 stage II sporulation protein P [Lysinibacillus irui]
MTLLKKLQWSFGILLFFFVLPVIAGQLPFNKQASTPIKQPEDKQVVFAATNLAEQSVLEQTKEPEADQAPDPGPDPFKVLVLFTHSHEAYEPMVKAVSGKVATSHETVNIMSLKDKIVNHFNVNGLKTDVLDVDIMKKLQAEGKGYHESYNVMRPYLSKHLETNNYDLILDLHRDSLKHDLTTISYNGENYAKIAIVVGAEHANFRWNTAYAESLSSTLNAIVPKISKGVISKSGDGVDGRYNQDLAKQMMIIEIGGIGNTEEEINRTIAVIGKAISKAFVNDSKK